MDEEMSNSNESVIDIDELEKNEDKPYDFQKANYVLPPFTPQPELPKKESDITTFVNHHRARIEANNVCEEKPTPFVHYAEKWQAKSGKVKEGWIQENFERFLKNTDNNYVAEIHYYKDYGFITCMQYSPNGDYIIVGYSSGLIGLRSGDNGTVIRNLRPIQFPPKPIYSIQFSRLEADVAYAACYDGAIYRINIPSTPSFPHTPTSHFIVADRTLVRLKTTFYGSTSEQLNTTPFIVQRTPALCFGILACNKKMAVGYESAMIKIYDMETQVCETTHKVQKLRLQFIPRKLQRLHTAPICALRAHEDIDTMFVTAGWDKTLRIWDTRCSIGCVATFEGVDVINDSIDINRNQCLVGSWQPAEALTLWDLTAKKRLNIIRVQNRRFDVDGEYIYACRYWKSSQFNRKGKYAIIGGSGTQCVEVVNLHNRYISCSYPADGAVLALTSHESKIAFGGTAPVFTLVTFHDPKHEKNNLHSYSGSFSEQPSKLDSSPMFLYQGI